MDDMLDTILIFKNPSRASVNRIKRKGADCNPKVNIKLRLPIYTEKALVIQAYRDKAEGKL